MEDISEALLLRQLLMITKALNRKPREALLPFGEDFIHLSSQFRSIAAELHTSNHRTSGARLEGKRRGQPDSFVEAFSGGGVLVNDESDPSTFTPNNTGIHGVSRRQPPDVHVQQLVRSAFTQFANHCKALGTLYTNPSVCLSSDERLLHLQPILFLERRQRNRSYRLSLRERLLLVCSSMSLAQDFRDYEERSGWMPKQDALLAAIMREESPSVQQIGKHFQSFLAAAHLPHEAYKQVDVGVRLGTKLNILENIGTLSAFGAALPFVLAFEVTKLLRLPYSSFKHFWAALSLVSSDSGVKKSTLTFSSWWTSYRAEYDKKYGNRPHNAGSCNDETPFADCPSVAQAPSGTVASRPGSPASASMLDFSDFMGTAPPNPSIRSDPATQLAGSSPAPMQLEDLMNITGSSSAGFRDSIGLDFDDYLDPPSGAMQHRGDSAEQGDPGQSWFDDYASLTTSVAGYAPHTACGIDFTDSQLA